MISRVLLQYTELLRIDFFDILLLSIGVILTLCLLQLSEFSIVDLVVQNVNLIVVMVLVLYVTLFTYFFNNISFLIKVVMFVPFVATSYLSLNSKLFVIWNYITVMSIYCIALPFMAIQANEVFVYIVLICSLLFMYKYLDNLISFLVIVCFIIIYNMMFLGVFSVFWCFVLSLDVVFTTEFVVASCFTGLILYVWVFGVYWYLSIKYFKKFLVKMCDDFETKSKLGVYFFVVSVCLFSLSIKCLYVFNVLVYRFFDVLGMIKWNGGTKNPHHFFSCCKKWSSTISGRKTCVEYTSCQFYKQLIPGFNKINNRVDYEKLIKDLQNIKNFYENKKQNEKVLNIENLLRSVVHSQVTHPKCVLDVDGQCQLYVITHSIYAKDVALKTIPLPFTFDNIVDFALLQNEDKFKIKFKPSRIVPVGYNLGSVLLEEEKNKLFDMFGFSLPDSKITPDNNWNDVHLFLLNEKVKQIKNLEQMLKMPLSTYKEEDLLLWNNIFNEYKLLVKEAQILRDNHKELAEYIEWQNKIGKK